MLASIGLYKHHARGSCLSNGMGTSPRFEDFKKFTRCTDRGCVVCAGYAHGQPGVAFTEGYGMPQEQPPQMPVTDFGMPEILPSPPLHPGADFVPHHPGASGQGDLSFPPIPSTSGARQRLIVHVPCSLSIDSSPGRMLLQGVPILVLSWSCLVHFFNALAELLIKSCSACSGVSAQVLCCMRRSGQWPRRLAVRHGRRAAAAGACGRGAPQPHGCASLWPSRC